MQVVYFIGTLGRSSMERSFMIAIDQLHRIFIWGYFCYGFCYFLFELACFGGIEVSDYDG